MKKALVVAIVMVLGLGALAFAGPMSGVFTTDICFSIQTDGTVLANDFSAELIVDYTVCGWEFESVSEFSVAGWDTQSFTTVGVLGAFSFASTLEFDPASAAFTYWDSTGGVSIAGISISGGFLLEDDGAGWTFGIGGSAGMCDLSATVYFNMDSAGNLIQTGYCFCFSSVEISTSFPFCCIDLVDVTLGFSNTGFDGITFSLDGVAVPGMGWLTYDLALTFDDGENGKTLSVTPGVDFGDVDACIDFGIELMTIGTAITGINIYSIGLECEMGQGVTFASYSYLDWPFHHFAPSTGTTLLADFWVESPAGSGIWIENTAIIATYGSLVGYGNWLCCETYWEKFSISSSSDACCGGGFEFDLDVYFGADGGWFWKPGPCCEELPEYTANCGDDPHDWLFDVARVDVSFSIGLGSNFSLTGGLAIQDYVYDWGTGLCVEGGLTEVCVGFKVAF